MAVHLETLGAEFLVKGFQSFFGTMKKADTAVDDLGVTSKGTSGILDSALSVALGQGLVMAANAAFDALVKVGTAAAGFVTEGFNMAVDFQSSLVGLELAAGATGLSFDQLHDAAIAVGGDTRLLGVSASGASEAMTSLFKAGLTEAQVMGDLNAYVEEGAELTGALRASIDLAAASELDMVEAADLASIVISSFGADAEKAGMNIEDWIVTAMDHMVRTADGSVASVEGLQASLINVGPAAAGAGMGMEDVNTALGVLSTRGIQGASAGTKLASMINGLKAPTDEAQGALDSLGITLRDSVTGELLPLPDLVAEFEEGLKGVSAAERDAALASIFTAAGMQSMQVLLEEGVEGWEDMEGAIDGASSMMDQAAKKADTYAGKMEAFEGVMETIKIQIGEALLPVATDLLNWISSMAEKYGPILVSIFERVGTGLSNLAEQFSFFSAFISFAVEEGDSLNDWLQELPEWFQPIAVAIADVMYVLDGMWAGLMAFVQGEWDFPWEDVFPLWLSDFLYNLTDMIDAFRTALALGVDPVAALSMAIQTYFGEQAATVFQNLWDLGQAVFGYLTVLFTEILPAAIEIAGAVFAEVLLPAFLAVAGFVITTVVPILTQLYSWLAEYLPIGIALVSEFITTVLLPAATIIWGFIQDSLIPILTTLYGWFMDLLPVAIEILTGIFEGVLMPVITLVWGFITESLIPILTTLAETAEVILGAAITILTDIWENVLMPVLNTVWDFIETVLIPVFNAVTEVIEAVLGVAITALTAIFENVLMPAVEDLVDFWNENIKPILQKAADEWFPKLQGAIENLVGPISNVVSWLGDLATKIASIKLPDWMQPGSPPPLFYALEDIAKGMKDVAGTTVKMGVQFDKLPAVNAAVGMLSASGGGYVRPVAPNQINSPYTNNTNSYDQSRTVNQNFVITPDILIESVGAVAI